MYPTKSCNFSQFEFKYTYFLLYILLKTEVKYMYSFLPKIMLTIQQKTFHASGKEVG